MGKLVRPIAQWWHASRWGVKAFTIRINPIGLRLGKRPGRVYAVVHILEFS
jgi:hypothetical protein